MARPATDPLDRTIWTPRLDARLLKYRKAKLTRPEIGMLLGVSEQAVGARLKKLRAVKAKSRPWKDTDDSELILRLRRDQTRAEIAAAMKRTLRAIGHRIDILRSWGRLPPAPQRRAHFVITSRLNAPR